MNRLPFIGRPALLAALAVSLLLGACAGPRGPAGTARGGPDASAGGASGVAAASCARRGGGYYLDDGPGCEPPADLAAIPDAVPRAEPLLPRTARPYVVFGREYRPMARLEPYKARGVATWYGRRYHGNPTSSGERYDMYAMTAAHPTLPIPSYARVTSLANGKSVVVRINDRGPFHSKRVIDLSYTAAHKLGYVKQGSARVRVESLDPESDDAGEALLAQGIYLQVGAFSRADNALELLNRLQRELQLDAGLSRVVLKRSLHHVQLGPYPSDAAAHADRARVRERLDLSAVLVRRE